MDFGEEKPLKLVPREDSFVAGEGAIEDRDAREVEVFLAAILVQ